MTNRTLIDQLNRNACLLRHEWIALLSSWTEAESAYARGLAVEAARAQFGNQIYVRGLIEFSNYCKNNCLYCGIRRDNGKAVRYRLSQADILACCQTG